MNMDKIAKALAGNRRLYVRDSFDVSYILIVSKEC